jgi:hypothetical protein
MFLRAVSPLLNDCSRLLLIFLIESGLSAPVYCGASELCFSSLGPLRHSSKTGLKSGFLDSATETGPSDFNSFSSPMNSVLLRSAVPKMKVLHFLRHGQESGVVKQLFLNLHFAPLILMTLNHGFRHSIIRVQKPRELPAVLMKNSWI